jgi:phosphoribosylanthranilate isomerase
MITKVKVCGITRLEDADAVVAAGADALGMNFAEVSRRRIDIERARHIAEHVSGAVCRVGLFVDAPAEAVRRVMDSVPLDVLQFHGDEAGAWCAQFGVRYWKAVRVRGPVDIAALEADHPEAEALLLDAYVPAQPGGTGQRFDWALWPRPGRLPLILAGGLDPDNVADAVRRLSPWGVDVCGGVEGDRPGVKDAGKIRHFVAEVHGARR